MATMNCPEGKLKIPVDIWYCKLVNKACPIQACIDTDEWSTFHEFCLADSNRQQKIHEAIVTGKYNGFHHMPGRYLCPMCGPSRKGNWERAYHYPWDLRPLSLFVPYDEEQLRVEIIKHHLPASAQVGDLCEKCLTKVLKRLGLPSLEEQAREYHGYGEPLNQGEPVSFLMYRNIREKQGGGTEFKGFCAWCKDHFSWNGSGESICYEVQVTFPQGSNEPFYICERCGNKLADLLQIE